MQKKLNVAELKENFSQFGQYDKYLSHLVEKKGYNVQNIKEVIDKSIANLKEDKRSFIIFGAPQSGKTEMMISLTSKLLDEGYNTIILLVTDHLTLLTQNLSRFKNSGMNPSPRNYKEIIDEPNYSKDKPMVVFCKKNGSNLRQLIEKLKGRDKKIIIDDEADYATPNSKINIDEVSSINNLTGKLIEEGGVYIGVTATPARLDLNHTHKNNPAYWIEYKPHENYTGQEIFFPADIDPKNLKFRLILLEEDYASSALTEALLNFLISSSHLNIVSAEVKGYSMLVHTSVKKSDHSEDKKHIAEVLNKLSNQKLDSGKEYYEKIWIQAEKRFPGQGQAIANYIAANINKCETLLLNSDRDKNIDANSIAANPSSPFTIIFGGNIVSRGVTFERLLSMFFTRDVKRTFQQDTYIQRARMFGSRKPILDHFELYIPKELYKNWQSCFISHSASIESVRLGNSPPLWIHTSKNAPTSKSSIYQNSVIMGGTGEMSFKIFDYDENFILDVIKSQTTEFEKLEKIAERFGDAALPRYLLTFIKLLKGEKSVVVRTPEDVSRWTSVDDKDNIIRSKGFMSFSATDKKRYGSANHHIQIFYNKKSKARVVYKYYMMDDRFMSNTANAKSYIKD